MRVVNARHVCRISLLLAMAAPQCTGSRSPADVVDVVRNDLAVIDATSDIDVSDSRVDGPSDAAPPPPPFDWIGIVGTGQSLSVGAEGLPRVSGATRYRNLALQDPRADGGAWGGFDASTAALTLVPLREPVRVTYPGFFAYPNNLGGETPHTAMADQITTLSIVTSGQDLVTLHSIIGISTEPLSALQPDGSTNSYAAALWEGRIFAERARTAGRTFGYGAIVVTHGEADQNNDEYGPQLYQYWQSLNRDLRAISGQSGVIPMLLSQQSSSPWPTAADAGVPNPERSASTLAQWQLGVDHPGEIVCVGPKYQYAPSAYVIHLTAAGYRRLGIKYGQVFYETAIRHSGWAPLQPTHASRSGRVIRLDFHVPVPPMQFDPNIAPPHPSGTLHSQWAQGRGFEVADSTGDLTIDSVAIDGDSVVITLSSDPTGGSMVVRYAMTPDHYGPGNGPINGRRGQLRDSDPFVGIDEQTVRCQLTQGSTMVTVAPMNSIATVGARDVVTGPGVPADTIVQSVVPPVRLTLRAPWSAPTGTYDITCAGRGVRVSAVNGSAILTTTVGTGGFIEIDRGAAVTGTGVPAGTTVESVDPPTQFILPSPWTGPSGVVDLTFHSDQRNYCVQFELPVP